MSNYLTESLESIKGDPRLDSSAKKLLGNKKILAVILKATVPEYKDISLQEIIPLIEGEPFISEIRLEPGFTNTSFTEAISGNNTENAEEGEGKILFDIVFYVRMKNGISKILINVEAQTIEKPGYPIINRTIFYECRLISSQKEREFVKSEYNDMIPTYTIWLCTSMEQNCMNVIKLQNTPIVGDHDWGKGEDIFNIVLIGLKKDENEEALKKEADELYQVLGTIFSTKLGVKEKEKILDPIIQIQNDTELKKELENMCNISYGIAEENFKHGIEQGKFDVIQRMLLDHVSEEKIKLYTQATDEEIERAKEDLLVK